MINVREVPLQVDLYPNEFSHDNFYKVSAYSRYDEDSFDSVPNVQRDGRVHFSENCISHTDIDLASEQSNDLFSKHCCNVWTNQIPFLDEFGDVCSTKFLCTDYYRQPANVLPKLNPKGSSQMISSKPGIATGFCVFVQRHSICANSIYWDNLSNIGDMPFIDNVAYSNEGVK